MSDIRELARGRWLEILPKCGVDAALLSGRHTPCPACGGKDRHRFDDKEGRGTHLCSQCGAGDGFEMLQKMHGCSFKEAVKIVEDALGIDGSKPLTKEQRAAYQRKLDSERAKHKKQEAEQYKKAAAESVRRWDAAKPADVSHPYLKTKDVKAFELRQEGEALLVPVYVDGDLTSLQSISTDGSKKFQPGGRIKAGFFAVPGAEKGRPRFIVIVEGYATGATIREASGYAVAVAFNAGNLLPAAEAIRELYPDTQIVIAADNDHQTDGNPGLTKGKAAADAVQGVIVCPEFTADEPGTDWNDYAAIHGLDAVREKFQSIEIKPLTNKNKAPNTGVQLINALSINVVRISWLWQGWLAVGKFHLLAGQAGTGKTTLALVWAAAITSGGRWPDGTQAPLGSVLIWTGEDSPADSLVPRLMAADADLKRVYFVGDMHDHRGPRNFNPATDMPYLIETASTIPDLKLVILDPVVSSVAKDGNSGVDVRRALQPLVDMADSLGVCVLGISHFSKGTRGADPLERVTGSVAFGAMARVVMSTVKPVNSKEKRRLVRTKSNIGPDGGGFEYELTRVMVRDGVEGQMVKWGDPIDGAAHELMAQIEADEDDRRTDRDDAAEWLQDILSDGPMNAKDVEAASKLAGIQWRTVQRAKKKAQVKWKRYGFGKESVIRWFLDGHDEPHT